MSKATDIDEVLATRNTNLLIDVLWDDEAIVGKIRAKLEKVSAENITHYHKHFCGSTAKKT